MVYAVGQQNANPYILAHEFRHKAFKDMPENDVRLLDAWSARNKKELDNALDYYSPKQKNKMIEILEDSGETLIIPLPDTYEKPDWNLEKERLVELHNYRARSTGRRELKQVKWYQEGKTGAVKAKRKPLSLGGLTAVLKRRQLNE